MGHLRRRSCDSAISEFRIDLDEDSGAEKTISPVTSFVMRSPALTRLGQWSEGVSEPLLSNQTQDRFKSRSRRWGWRRIVGYSAPVLALVGLIIAGTEHSTILALRSSLSRVHATLHLNVSLVYDRTACNQFRVRIARTDPDVCQEARGRKVSESAEDQKYITERLGPDTFNVRVDGAERHALLSPDRYDADECAYEFDFRLSTPGVVWLNIFFIYTNFEGFYDRHTVEDRLHQQYAVVLPHPLQLNLCAPSCQPFVSPLISSPSSVFDPYNAPPAPLPACTGPEPIPGAYVRATLYSILYPLVPLPAVASRPLGGLFDFIPTGCTMQHDGLRFRDHSSCLLEDRGVLFTGDSHGRLIFDVLRHRLAGDNRVTTKSDKVAVASGRIGKLRLEFTWDAFLEEPMDCKFMRNIDSIVISYGTHPATFRCASTPTSVFKSHLASVLSSWPRALAACHAPDARRPTLIYYNAPLMIQTPQQHLECRTGPRMEYWNRLAGKLARDHGWQVVDAFAHTKAFAIDTPLTDGNHHFGLDDLDPMADEVIEKLGICGSG